MKIFKKNILLSVILLSYNISTLGYNFVFSNITEKFLVLCYKLEGLSQEYYQIIPPDQSTSHYFPNAHCFGASILWAELKEYDVFGQALPFKGGFDLVDPETGGIALGNMQQLFKQHLAHKYAFIPMQIKVVDNETFQMTVDAAEKFMKGIDSLTCQIIKTTAQFVNPASGLTSTAAKALTASATTPAPEQSVEDEFLSLLKSAGMEQTEELLGQEINQDISHDVVKSAAVNKVIKDCRFGLGKIAAGGAGLAGVSLCRDLHFAIVDTGEIGLPVPVKPGMNVSRVKKPILIAEINQGG